MKTNELRKLSDDKLKKRLQEFELMILGSYGKAKPLIKPEQRRGVKKMIARIKTIMRERQNGSRNTN